MRRVGSSNFLKVASGVICLVCVLFGIGLLTWVFSGPSPRVTIPVKNKPSLVVKSSAESSFDRLETARLNAARSVKLATVPPVPGRAPLPGSLAPVTLRATDRVTSLELATVPPVGSPAGQTIELATISSVPVRSSHLLPAPVTLTHVSSPPVAAQPELLFSHTPSELPKPVSLSVRSPLVKTRIQLATLNKIAEEVKPPPPLELERQRTETFVDTDTTGVQIVTGFEGSTPLSIEKISDTHFRVRITTEGFRNWFMFRVVGIPSEGQTLRIDIVDAPVHKWWSLNPVYSYVTDLAVLQAFESFPLTDPKPPIAAYNRPLLPDTRGQSWHFTSDVWSEGKSVLSTVNRYETDAYVALKVPYTPSYDETYLATLSNEPGLKVHRVGHSELGRPLHVIQIGTGDPRKVPCVLLYAREHANEQDTSWAVQGAIDFLRTDEARASGILDRVTFLAIPLLDPDGASAGRYEIITQNFVYDGEEGPEARAYAAFFKKWVDADYRLDLVFNLHNVESAEAPHLSCPLMESQKARKAHSQQLHRRVMTLAGEAGYVVAPQSWGHGTADFRLGGYLKKFYGPLHMPYEVNTQEKGQHLSLKESRLIGALLVQASTDFLGAPETESLIDNIREQRGHHRNRMNKYEGLFKERAIDNALQIEWVSWHRELTQRPATNNKAQ